VTISLVIGVIDQHDFTARCLERLAEVTTEEIEVIVIDNGSEKPRTWKSQGKLKVKNQHNGENIGVLPTFKQGVELSSGDLVCFIHNDVLIHEQGWNERVAWAFAEDHKLGLAGLLGARGVNPDGGREGTMSHMLGAEWGKTEIQPAAIHHGELMMARHSAIVLDGVGMFFRKSALHDVAEHSNIFADDRPPHHWYDRNICLNFIFRGWHVDVIGIQFDHFSGATANVSPQYHLGAKRWCEEHGAEMPENNADLGVYKVGEKQFLEEWGKYLPAHVDEHHNVTWRFSPYV